METMVEYLSNFKCYLDKARRWPYFWLSVLVTLTFFLHLTTISNPPDLVFDEHWYVEDARFIAEGTGSFIPQHPPLGRLIIAGGITVFGDDPFGWRIFPVMFGLAGIVLIYLICKELKLPDQLALIAAFLLAFENFSFVQSSIGMLDVFSVTFALAAFLLYLKGRYMVSGGLIALSMLAKFTGVLAIPVIGLHWLLTNRKNWFRFGLSIALIPVFYMVMLPALDWIIWGKFIDPLEETITMLRLNSYSTFAEIDSTLLSRPWEWLLNLKIITYWPDPHYLAMLSPNIWLVAIPSMAYMAVKARRGSNAAIFCLAWFTGTYLIWIPISLITDRTSYVFYLYPVIGALCLAVAISLWDLTKNYPAFNSSVLKRLLKWSVTVFLIVHTGFFVYLAPIPYAWKLAAGVLLYVFIRYLFSPDKLNTPQPMSIDHGNDSNG
ncbi:glycosyltransferase family 39 protein [Dehalogenimonas sp. THU2]|uniref:glycosyltransferase family 39 protein n=1 Tax=Dehalogenimonas sp. THU2 TaxID=3151121 RepID=UPI0032181E81